MLSKISQAQKAKCCSYVESTPKMMTMMMVGLECNTCYVFITNATYVPHFHGSHMLENDFSGQITIAVLQVASASLCKAM
jgi:hypothetical protein